MSLRAPNVEDASSIAAISIEVWIGTYITRGVSAFFADFALSEFTTEKITRLIRDPRQFMLVSQTAEGIDGFLRLTRNSPAPVGTGFDTEISTLYVQPRHHGKGIGGRLLAAALDQCRREGAHSAWLATNAENHPAIRFYQAQGFEPVGETHFRIGEEAYLNNVYAIRL